MRAKKKKNKSQIKKSTLEKVFIFLYKKRAKNLLSMKSRQTEGGLTLIEY